jgi:hypothetical protein
MALRHGVEEIGGVAMDTVQQGFVDEIGTAHGTQHSVTLLASQV